MFKVKTILLGMVRTNCYIIYNENNEAIIIDPADRADKIIGFIEENNLKPMAVLLTHGHFDHIGAVSDLKKKYDIKVYAHHDEKDVLNIQNMNLSTSFYMDISIDADEYFMDGATLNIGEFSIKTLHTPGHTKGSVCYLADDVIFSGDTMFQGTYGRTDFPTGSESAIIHSIKDKLLTLDDNLKVYPGHGEATTIGEEKRYY